MMKGVFKGFLVLRLVGFLALFVVVAVVVGIRSLVRGSDVVGVAALAGAVVGAAALGSLVARRSSRRHQ